MRNAFLYLLILIAGCKPSDDNVTNSDTDTILTINVENNAVLQGYRSFYSIKGEDGEDLSFGELFNSDTIVIEEPTYRKEKIAVTIFHYSAGNYVKVKSYLEIPLGKSITILNTISFNDSSLHLGIKNFPSNFEEIIISKSRYFTPFHFTVDNTVQYNFSEDQPNLYITTRFSDNRPKYQTVIAEKNSELIIDLNQSIDMENDHTIFSRLESVGNFKYEINLSGQIDDLNYINRYILYVDSNLAISSDILKAYTPKIFQKFKLLLTAKNDNISHIQITDGAIPETFDFINPEINITDDTFKNMDITSSKNNVSYVHSLWRLETADLLNGIFWDVITPTSTKNNYKIYEIPDFITGKIDFSNEQSELLSLRSVSAVNRNNLDYSIAIDELLRKPSSSTSIVLAKKISTNQ